MGRKNTKKTASCCLWQIGAGFLGILEFTKANRAVITFMESGAFTHHVS